MKSPLTKSLRRTKLLWAWIIAGVVFGNLVAIYYAPKEGFVDVARYITNKTVINGVSAIPYNTTGPIISSFERGCYSSGDFGIGTGYYCLVVEYHGGPGVVELKIPSYLLTDNYKWIRTIEVSGKPIPFQRINNENGYSTFHIDLPLGTNSRNEIVLKGGDNFPLWLDYMGNAAMFTNFGFFIAMFTWLLFYLLIQHVKKKLQVHTK